jgi:aspartate kinase
MNANTVTHFVTGTLSRAKHAIAELERLFPQADIDLRRVGLVSVIGSDLDRPGLLADTVGCLHQSGVDVIALHQGMRQVDIQIIVDEADYDAAIKTLHERLVENKESVGDLNAA